jgi:hypothetical protein
MSSMDVELIGRDVFRSTESPALLACHAAPVRVGALALGLAVAAAVALVINFVGAAGGHCDESCSGNFPFWLYVGSGWVVVLCVVLLLAVGVIALIQRISRS